MRSRRLARNDPPKSILGPWPSRTCRVFFRSSQHDIPALATTLDRNTHLIVQEGVEEFKRAVVPDRIGARFVAGFHGLKMPVTSRPSTNLSATNPFQFQPTPSLLIHRRPCNSGHEGHVYPTCTSEAAGRDGSACNLLLAGTPLKVVAGPTQRPCASIRPNPATVFRMRHRSEKQQQ